MKLNGAMVLTETLKEQGVDTVFGYPGATVIDIYDALMREGSEIKHVLTADEQGAVHAADGYARATGKVGVAIATSGPGATNLVTGIATAFLDSIPLVAITGNVKSSLIGRDAFQEIDITGITIPITKHNFFVDNIEDLADTVRTAFEIAQSGRSGPVLIDIPQDIQQEECEFETKEPLALQEINKASDEEIEKAASMIREAKRPYIYFGGGALRADMGAEIKKLADKIGAYMGCSMMGLSLIPTDEPRFLGMQGRNRKTRRISRNFGQKL